jgi:hypothetical protein
MLKIASDACVRLFAHYGCPLRPSPGASGPPLAFHGVIGFSARGLQGQLILGSSIEPLEQSNPARNVPVRDWMGELSNQLLGRIKSQLLLYGVELTVSTPLILRDSHLAEHPSAGLPSLAFKGSPGLVRVWLELTFSKRFKMADKPDPALGGPVESDTVFL